MEIRLPSQLILAGESLEVDNLVTRATPIEGKSGGPLVPREEAGTFERPSASRAVTVPETKVVGESRAAPRALGYARGKSPIDLYRWVDHMYQTQPSAALDVFA